MFKCRFGKEVYSFKEWYYQETILSYSFRNSSPLWGPEHPDRPDRLTAAPFTLTSRTTLTISTDPKKYEEDKCRIHIVYFVLFVLV